MEAWHAVVCRDSDVDLETAANAGMDVIPVCWDFAPEISDRAWSGE